MRRANFFIGALVAIVTYASLSAFVGRRPWGWRRNHCYYNDRARSYDRRENDWNTPFRDSIPIQ